MNGEQLPQKHGFPVRLLAPGKYGIKHPKWITEITLMDEETFGYWQQQGWTQEARMNTSVRIDVPGFYGEAAPNSTYLIAGPVLLGRPRHQQGRGLDRQPQDVVRSRPQAAPGAVHLGAVVLRVACSA